MFSQSIVESDAYLDMPLGTQALYFHLGMNADDDGFVNPKRVMRMVGANDDDLKILIAKRFILAFDSGIVVVKHWPTNNFIRTDRYKATAYKNELSKLAKNENGDYTEIHKNTTTMQFVTDTVVHSETIGIPNDSHAVYPSKVRLGKAKLSKSKKLTVEKPTDSEISKLYYEAIRALDLPVRNHNTLRLKIKEMEQMTNKNRVISYLLFVRDIYKTAPLDHKPELNEALDIHAKMVAVESSYNRTVNNAANPKTVKL